MTLRSRFLLSILLLPPAALTGSPSAAAGQPPGVRARADTADVTHFFPDSLWANTVAVDSARVYRDSLAQEVGAAEALATDPLAAGRSGTSFAYNTSYGVAQSSTSWGNSSTFSMQRDRLVVTNKTNITLDRYLAAGNVSPRQQRNSETEFSYRFSPQFSLGSRAKLDRTLTSASTLTSADRQDQNNFAFSAKGRMRPTPYARADLNVFGGYDSEERPTYGKDGLSGDANGSLNLQLSGLGTLSMTGRANGKRSRASLSEETAQKASTRDLSRAVNGTLGVLPGRKLGLNVNGSARRVQVQSPLIVPEAGISAIQEVLTRSGDVGATLQGRLSNERYFTVTHRQATENKGYSIRSDDNSGRRDRTWSADLHEVRWAFKLDGTFNNGRTRNDFSSDLSTERRPSPMDPGSFVTDTFPAGYVERVHNRSLDVTLQRPLGRRLNLKVQGTVSLSSFRYALVTDSRARLVDRDQYRRTFLAEGRFNPGQRWNTSLNYQQELRKNINLPASHSNANLEDRRYLLTWSWSYRISQGLTASQRNSVSANYQKRTFGPDSSGLRMEFNFLTTLESSVIPNRLRLTLTHSARFQPNGAFQYDTFEGQDLFYKSDETRLYSLDARIAYSPATWLTLNLNPSYQSDQRLATQGQALSPQSTVNSLRLSGGASVRRQIGAHGNLSGDLSRLFLADGRTSYVQGLAGVPVRNETDYWQGRLDFSWSY